ncbi:type 1 fimbrial protein [Pseudomonas sp. nanlin1]|uniref:type 1 fimbrial protein n=1 Tax=Pseudomonas sp. nanlin1 TaxID=3040605 RepID=UPI00388E1564
MSFALFSSFSSAGQAAQPNGQGEIRFAGSVVEAACSALSSTDGWRLDGCSAPVRAPDINVRRMDTPAAASADSSVQARLIASNAQGRYYNQQYRLVNSTGQTVTSGHYLVTLTAP